MQFGHDAELRHRRINLRDGQYQLALAALGRNPSRVGHGREKSQERRSSFGRKTGNGTNKFQQPWLLAQICHLNHPSRLGTPVYEAQPSIRLRIAAVLANAIIMHRQISMAIP
jgi:hypothetical protein